MYFYFSGWICHLLVSFHVSMNVLGIIILLKVDWAKHSGGLFHRRECLTPRVQFLKVSTRKMAHGGNKLCNLKKSFPSLNTILRANFSLTFYWMVKRLAHNPKLVFLGVTLDYTLTYTHHLTTVARKIKRRRCLLNKLIGLPVGANAQTLHN